MKNIAFIGTGKIAQAFIQGLGDEKWNLRAYDPAQEALKIAEKLGAIAEKNSFSTGGNFQDGKTSESPRSVTAAEGAETLAIKGVLYFLYSGRIFFLKSSIPLLGMPIEFNIL